MTYTKEDLFAFHEFAKNFYFHDDTHTSGRVYKMRMDNRVYTEDEIIELFNKQNNGTRTN